jgi:hypothetical protein
MALEYQAKAQEGDAVCGLAYTEVPSAELATFFDEEAFVGH